MPTLLAVLPLALALGLALRGASAWSACLIGILAALAAPLLSDKFALAPADALPILASAAILTANAACVVVGGLLLNEVLRGQGRIEAIVRWIEKSGIPRARIAVILVLGLGPFLGSATGFGLGMFVTLPVLMQVVGARPALKITALSMMIMP